MTILDVIFRQSNCCKSLCCMTHVRTLSEYYLFYEVVYGSPCGRPENVCLFILP